MREGRLRKLFVRYRERGDVEALTAVFDATAPDLANLARRLVHVGDADDVVQSTFLTAIERSANYDSDQPLQPWLTGILVRKARQANEQGKRAPEPEAAEPETADDPARGARETELAEELRQALAELPDHYRAVLQPFLHDGDRPQDIARRQGVAPGTVRVQIHRGLALLRKALPASYAGGALATGLSASALDGMRAQVAKAAGAAGSVSAPAAPAATSWAGSRLMIGLALVFVGAGAWHWSRPGDSGAAETRSAALTLPDTTPAIDEGTLPVEEPETLAPQAQSLPAARTAAADTGERAAWTLVLDVTGLDPAPPGELLLEVGYGDEADAAKTVALLENGPRSVPLEGLTTQSSSAPPPVTLRVTHGAFAPFEHAVTASDVRRPGEIAVSVALERTATIVIGRVVTSLDTEPRIGFFPAARGAEEVGRAKTASCDAEGAFTLYTSETQGWFAAAAEQCAPFGRHLELPEHGLVDLGTIELDEGAAIEGMTYANGGPSGGSIHVQRVDAQDAPTGHLLAGPLAFVDDAVVSASALGRSDETGTFRIGGLTPGVYDVVFVPPLGASGYFDPEDHGTRVTAPASGLELVSPVQVYTIRIASRGEPVADATVHYFLDGGSVAGPTRPDGTYEFFMAQWDERHRVEISKPGFAARELSIGPQDFDTDATLHVELERVAEASDLTLELDCEGAIGSLVLRMTLDESDWYIYRPLEPRGGVIELGELPAGSYHLTLEPTFDEAVAPAQLPSWLKTEIDLACRPAMSERIRVELSPGGRPAFELIGATASGAGHWSLTGDGGFHSVHLLWWDVERGAAQVFYTPLDIVEDGTYWLKSPVPAGEYRLEVRRPDGEIQQESIEVAAGRTVNVPVDVR